MKAPEGKMGRSLAALFVLALSMPVKGQDTWDLAKCRQDLTVGHFKEGHVCTPEHLAADLAQLLKDPTVRAAGMSPQQVHGLAESGWVEDKADLDRLAQTMKASRAEAEAAEVNRSMYVRLAQAIGAQHGLTDGATLLDACEQTERMVDAAKEFLCYGYIEGVADSLEVHGLIEWGNRQSRIARGDLTEAARDASARPPIFCSPAGGTYGQYVKVVLKFLRDHPERLHEHRRNLVEDALQNAFPCPVR
jgi:hypothetical protein